jgi:hypothetical protein
MIILLDLENGDSSAVLYRSRKKDQGEVLNHG